MVDVQQIDQRPVLADPPALAALDIEVVRVRAEAWGA
jgi:hypothetical protein